MKMVTMFGGNGCSDGIMMLVLMIMVMMVTMMKIIMIGGGDDDCNVNDRIIKQILKIISPVWPLAHIRWYRVERLLRDSYCVTQRNACYQTAR
jgi:hypothetical protein